jgi:hypothetical protein
MLYYNFFISNGKMKSTKINIVNTSSGSLYCGRTHIVIFKVKYHRTVFWYVDHFKRNSSLSHKFLLFRKYDPCYSFWMFMLLILVILVECQNRPEPQIDASTLHAMCTTLLWFIFPFLSSIQKNWFILNGFLFKS